MLRNYTIPWQLDRNVFVFLSKSANTSRCTIGHRQELCIDDEVNHKILSQKYLHSFMILYLVLYDKISAFRFLRNNAEFGKLSFQM